MNKEYFELQWKDASSQDIPEKLESTSMILKGGTASPIFWQPKPEPEPHFCAEDAEPNICSAENLNTPTGWFLRYEPASLLIPLPASGIRIGSRSENSLILDNPTISGTHACLTAADDGWILEDLGSLNGTFVNGKPVENPVLLKKNDSFTLSRGKSFRIEKVEDDE